ncbi:unnamed protein product [Cladocopium goreaui]|uniref:Uncharacterized protein n=1 Tax=Cladocopium goreaui TaxID=2562237 RepID=A0A9P1CS47_9DINO|nr:unnamed protein product [Cladocopium goreaui]
MGLAVAVAVAATPILVLQMQLIQLLKSPVTVAVLAVFHDLMIVLYFVLMGGETFSEAQVIGYAVDDSELYRWPQPSRRAWLALVAVAAGGWVPRRVARAAAKRLKENSDLWKVSYPAFEAGDEVLQEVQLVTTGVPAGPPAQWAGLWRVSYAPHIRTLGSLGFTKFDVYYDIAPSAAASPEISSFVRFEGPFWRGWLNSSGTISTLSEDEVQVDFQNFWVDWDSEQPRRSGSDFFSEIAKKFFFLELSRFPVLSLDTSEGTTVFRFPALGVQIAACRVGPSGSDPRPL